MTEDATVELLTPERWVEHGNSTSVKKRRRLVQKYWVTANSFPSVTEGIKAVQNEGLYRSIDTAMGFLEKKGLTPASLHQFRNVYKDFIKACIGKLDDERFQAIVKKFENSTTTEKYTPILDEVREILLRANTRGKALVSMLANTGMRINEALSRKRSDIEFDYHPFPEVVVPARIRIEAQSTKKKYTRYCYLSHEGVKLLHDFWKEARQSDWVFPSEWAKNRDTHLLDSNLRKEFKSLFDKLGLTPKQADVIFSPHSFRSFCLGVMRQSGFSDVQGQIIVGHKNLETKSYKGNERDIAKDWAKKVEPHMTFLTAPTEDMKKLEGALKSQKAEFETQKDQWDQITKEMAIVRDALKKASETKNYSELTETLARVKNEAQARMGSDPKSKRFDNHVWSYVKCRMADSEFDEALIEGYEILLQSPDGWVTLRKQKVQPEVDEGTLSKLGA